MSLTPGQQDHSDNLIEITTELMRAKYLAGAIEHSGNLYDLSTTQLVDEAINEAIDQLHYLLTLKEKLK